MKRLHTILAALVVSAAANAQIGAPYIHDPSTIAECDGKYVMENTTPSAQVAEVSYQMMAGAGTVVQSALVAVQPPTCLR